METKGRLIIMVGLPRSGKSTIARYNTDLGYVIVCPDDIRKALGCFPYDRAKEPEVWHIARTMAKALIHSGHKRIVIDATNTTHDGNRLQWINLAREYDYDYFYCYVATPADECKRRAMESGQGYLVPIIDRMEAQFDFGAWTGDGNLVDTNFCVI